MNYSETTLLTPECEITQAPEPSPLRWEAVEPAWQKLFEYVKVNNYEGYDLYDGLNSPFLKSLPLYKNRIFRLIMIQLGKHAQVNYRPMLGIQKSFNPKGGALFLMGLINVFKRKPKDVYANEAYILFKRLSHLAISRERGNGWGYNFDWQARAFFVPEGTPNIVTSVYVGYALLAYFETFHEPYALELALGITDFILHEMLLFENEDEACFRYIPGQEAAVHNANLLGASYLAETIHYFPESRQPRMADLIGKSIRFSLQDIQDNGSWPYGTAHHHRWMDNFHTGFNLDSLQRIQDRLGLEQITPDINQVLDYYLKNLFTGDGIPKYYNNKLFPVDVHVIAVTIIILNQLRQKESLEHEPRRAQIEKTMSELIALFQDKEGYFYYQQKRRSMNKLPYIRWGQAWMFYALSTSAVTD